MFLVYKLTVHQMLFLLTMTLVNSQFANKIAWDITSYDVPMVHNITEQWYYCPHGYVLGGFYKNTGSSLRNIQKMKCVAPTYPNLISQTCYQTNMFYESISDKTIQCDAGYFVSGLYGSDYIKYLRCCQYNQSIIRYSNNTLKHNTYNWTDSDCAVFPTQTVDNVTAHAAWCVVNDSEYIIGFQGTIANTLSGNLFLTSSTSTNSTSTNSTSTNPPIQIYTEFTTNLTSTINMETSIDVINSDHVLSANIETDSVHVSIIASILFCLLTMGGIYIPFKLNSYLQKQQSIDENKKLVMSHANVKHNIDESIELNEISAAKNRSASAKIVLSLEQLGKLHTIHESINESDEKKSDHDNTHTQTISSVLTDLNNIKLRAMNDKVMCEKSEEFILLSGLLANVLDDNASNEAVREYEIK